MGRRWSLSCCAVLVVVGSVGRGVVGSDGGLYDAVADRLVVEHLDATNFDAHVKSDAFGSPAWLVEPRHVFLKIDPADPSGTVGADERPLDSPTCIYMPTMCPLNHPHTSRCYTRGARNGAACRFIEFYAAWCGHCQRFSGPFKTFAKSIQPWKSWVRVGAIDCANVNNTDTCRDHNVSGFPTLKIFTAGTKVDAPDPPSFEGTRTLQGLRHAVATHLATVEPIAHQLRPLEASAMLTGLRQAPAHDELWVLTNASHGDNSTTPWAWELALDLRSQLRDATVPIRVVQGRGDDPANPFAMLAPHIAVTMPLGLAHLTAVSGAPQLTLVHQGDPRLIVPSKENTHYHAFRDSFIDAAATLGLVEARVINDAADAALRPPPPPPPAESAMAVGGTSRPGDLRDSMAAVFHALWQEVPIHRSISGPKLAALQKFVWMVARVMPLPPKGALDADLLVVFTLLSQRLMVAVKAHATVTSADYAGMLSEALAAGSAEAFDVTAAASTWYHCQGSRAPLRGYPCGLWTLFHTLVGVATVQGGDPSAIFDGIVGYVTHFFGCRECSENFLRETEVWAADEVPRTAYGSAVLFLWAVHNKANLRLGADPKATNNDPEHPKASFPSVAECPLCRVSDSSKRAVGDVAWNVSAVLEHLLTQYAVASRQQAGRVTIFPPRMIRQMSSAIRALNASTLYTVAATGSIHREVGSHILARSEEVTVHFTKTGAAGAGPIDRIVIAPRDARAESWLWRVWVVVLVAAGVCTVYFKLNPMAAARRHLGGKHSPLLPTAIRSKNID
jgi:thiol oxidase